MQELNIGAAIIVCAKQWGKTPDEIESLLEKKKIGLQHLYKASMLEIIESNNPEYLQEYLFPGSKEERKQTRYQAMTNKAFADIVSLAERQKNIEQARKARGENGG